MTVRLLERYRSEVAPELAEEFGRPNRLSVPRPEKIVVTMGIGRAVKEEGVLETAAEELARNTGQKPVVRHHDLCQPREIPQIVPFHVLDGQADRTL